MHAFIRFLELLRSLLSIAAQIATICGFGYAFFWLKDFKKQKRIENRIAAAERAFYELFSVRNLLEAFLTEKNDNVREQARPELSSALNTLCHTLILLQEYDQISIAIDWIEEVEAVLMGDEFSTSYKCREKIEEITDWHNENKLDKLRMALREIRNIK